MGSVQIDAVTKRFGDGTIAVDNVSLDVPQGEFMVLVGPSGCGKTTLLRLVAGLEQPSSGRILIDGGDVTHALPRERDIAMVFQDYALYPHMTVAENLGFGLKLRRTPRRERQKGVAEIAALLGLEPLLGRRPAQLSGGQRQRVAMGRAMVREPAAFLMDEPLSNLDAKLRVQMRSELARMRDRLRTTTIYVTHDQVEAMTLGDRVAVMRDGQLQQLAAPEELFRHPANLFVAAFIGSPAMNLVEARVGEGTLEFGGHSLPGNGLPSVSAGEGKTVVIGLRPSAFEDAAFAHGDHNTSIEVVPDLVERLGDEVQVAFPVQEPPVLTEEVRAASVAEGEAEAEGRALLLFDEHKDETTTFIARLNPRTNATPGQRLVLTVETQEIYFFDPDTGRASDLR